MKDPVVFRSNDYHMTDDQVLQACGISKRTLYYWKKKGAPKIYKKYLELIGNGDLCTLGWDNWIISEDKLLCTEYDVEFTKRDLHKIWIDLQRLTTHEGPARPEELEGRFEKRSALFSSAEQSLYSTLEEIVPGSYHILSKIRLSDVLEVKKEVCLADRERSLKHINLTFINFLLCDDKFSAECAITLCPSDTLSAEALEEDRILNRLFDSVDLPHIRFEAKSHYDFDEVRDKLSFLDI